MTASAPSAQSIGDQSMPGLLTPSWPFAYLAAWAAIAFGLLAAIFILVASGMKIQIIGLGFLSISWLMLLMTHLFYTILRPSKLLCDTTGILLMMISASLIAAVICHAGLRLGMPWFDSALSSADAAIGIDTSKLAVLSAADSGFGQSLALVYGSTMPAVFMTALWLGFNGQGNRMWELGFCYTICVLVASIISVALPALGNMAYHDIKDVPGLPNGAGVFHLSAIEYFRYGDNPIFDWSRVDGIVTFPSFHMAMALMVPRAFRGHKWLYLPAIFWSLLVMVSTIGIGGHYVVDLLAGALLWGLCVFSLASAKTTKIGDELPSHVSMKRFC